MVDRGLLYSAKGPKVLSLASLPSRSPQKAAITMWDLAIWTYQAQKAHLGRESAHNPGYSSLSSTGRVERICRLGGFISGGGPRRTHCDDDALTVHGIVERFPSNDRALIIRTASIATMPEWSPLIPEYRFVPVKGRKGANKGIYDRNGNLIGHEIQPVGFAPDRAAHAIAHAREVYQSWYAALFALREWLMGEPMYRWAVTGIGAEAAPWAS